MLRSGWKQASDAWGQGVVKHLASLQAILRGINAKALKKLVKQPKL